MYTTNIKTCHSNRINWRATWISPSTLFFFFFDYLFTSFIMQETNGQLRWMFNQTLFWQLWELKENIRKQQRKEDRRCVCEGNKKKRIFRHLLCKKEKVVKKHQNIFKTKTNDLINPPFFWQRLNSVWFNQSQDKYLY